MAGFISSERTPVEQPGVRIGAFRYGKAGCCTYKWLKTQFQRSRFDCTLPMVSLTLRSGQNEHRQHVLIGRPAFRTLAPAQKALQRTSLGLRPGVVKASAAWSRRPCSTSWRSSNVGNRESLRSTPTTSACQLFVSSRTGMHSYPAGRCRTTKRLGNALSDILLLSFRLKIVKAPVL
jgi:hypothetical protein